MLKQAAVGAAVVWVTHDDQQPGRVGGKVLQLPAGDEAEVSVPLILASRCQQCSAALPGSVGCPACRR